MAFAWVDSVACPTCGAPEGHPCGSGDVTRGTWARLPGNNHHHTRQTLAGSLGVVRAITGEPDPEPVQLALFEERPRR